MTGGTPPNKRSLDRAQRNPGNGREACTPEPGFRFQAGSHFGLTPKKYQSGETDYSGRISKIGDASVREALYEAAHIILTKPIKGCSQLKGWATRLARRRHEQGQDRPRAQACRHHASHAQGQHAVQSGCQASLKKENQ
jgi:transposase IS116/IS110/IS902 family protein